MTEMFIINNLLKDCCFHSNNKPLNKHLVKWEIVSCINPSKIAVHYKKVNYL